MTKVLNFFTYHRSSNAIVFFSGSGQGRDVIIFVTATDLYVELGLVSMRD